MQPFLVKIGKFGVPHFPEFAMGFFLKTKFGFLTVVNAEEPFFTISQFKAKQGLFHSFNPHSTMARSHTTQNRDFLESISFSF